MSDAPAARAGASRASLAVQLISLAYDAILLVGVVVVAAGLLMPLAGAIAPRAALPRWLLQAWIFSIVGAYFVWCWTRTGQTLAMKTWRLRVEHEAGGLLAPHTALLRYLLAWQLVVPGLLLAAWFGRGPASYAVAFGIGVFATAALALTDRQRRGLHDRLLSTRVVRLDRATATRGTAAPAGLAQAMPAAQAAGRRPAWPEGRA